MSKSMTAATTATIEETEERLDLARDGIEVGEHAGILYVTRQDGDDETVIEAEHINVVRVTIYGLSTRVLPAGSAEIELSRKQAEATGLMLLRVADRMSR